MDQNSILSRVLEEVKAAESLTGQTTAHSTYVSGLFEDTNQDECVSKQIESN